VDYVEEYVANKKDWSQKEKEDFLKQHEQFVEARGPIPNDNIRTASIKTEMLLAAMRTPRLLSFFTRYTRVMSGYVGKVMQSVYYKLPGFIKGDTPGVVC